jgi:hypothetical protein
MEMARAESRQRLSPRDDLLFDRETGMRVWLVLCQKDKPNQI